MSGCAARSQPATPSARILIELTFQLAILSGIGGFSHEFLASIVDVRPSAVTQNPQARRKFDDEPFMA
jgi:hypothetical protein